MPETDKIPPYMNVGVSDRSPRQDFSVWAGPFDACSPPMIHVYLEADPFTCQCGMTSNIMSIHEDPDDDQVPGFTEKENEAWNAVCYAADVCSDLETVYPGGSEADEIVKCFNTLTYYLLSRPTYRKYLEVNGYNDMEEDDDGSDGSTGGPESGSSSNEPDGPSADNDY